MSSLLNLAIYNTVNLPKSKDLKPNNFGNFAEYFIKLNIKMPKYFQNIATLAKILSGV